MKICGKNQCLKILFPAEAVELFFGSDSSREIRLSCSIETISRDKFSGYDSAYAETSTVPFRLKPDLSTFKSIPVYMGTSLPPRRRGQPPFWLRLATTTIQVGRGCRSCYVAKATSQSSKSKQLGTTMLCIELSMVSLYFPCRPGFFSFSALIGLLFIITRRRLIFRLRAIVWNAF